MTDRKAVGEIVRMAVEMRDSEKEWQLELHWGAQKNGSKNTFGWSLHLEHHALCKRKKITFVTSV